jgi:hypothetical protein
MEKKKIIIIILIIFIVIASCFIAPFVMKQEKQENNQMSTEEQNKNDESSEDVNNNLDNNNNLPSFDNQLKPEGDHDEDEDKNDQNDSNSANKNDNELNNDVGAEDNEIKDDNSSEETENKDGDEDETESYDHIKGDMIIDNPAKFSSSDCRIVSEKSEDLFVARTTQFEIELKVEVDKLADGDVVEISKLIEPSLIKTCEEALGEKVTYEYVSIYDARPQSERGLLVVSGKMKGETEERCFSIFYKTIPYRNGDVQQVDCISIIDASGNEEFFNTIIDYSLEELNKN